MLDAHRDFGPFDGHVWLNCAHQGPMPRVAIDRAKEAIEWKRRPFELTTERFSGVPAQLRSALARLIEAPADEIVLANSASYGLHLLANGLPLKAGDEVLLTRGDFPSVIYPWTGLERAGVRIRYIEPAHEVVTADELRTRLTPRTRVFCATWVHSFSGRAIDLEAIGALCAANGALFIANASQAIGTRPLDVSTTPVDAVVSVGFKWLCGPYGTGFCWIRRDVMQRLDYNQTYWLSLQTADDLGRPGVDLPMPEQPSTGRRFDVFGTANFFNFVPWIASIEYLLAHGVPAIATHNQALIDHFIEHLDTNRYRLTSPARGPSRSTLLLLTHREPERNETIYERLKAKGIHLAFRRGRLRLAPHCYNTMADIDAALDALHACG